MKISLHGLKTGLAALGLAGLMGCAQLSPQLLSFESGVTEETVIDAPVTISLTVMDNRAESTIGYRGGVYSETATIESKKPMQELVAEQAQEALALAGAEITNMFPQYEMQISVDQFDYVTEDKKAGIKRSTGTVKMSILVSSGNSTFKNSFKTSEFQETFGYPNDEKNQQLLNNIFSAVMNRMFSDPDLERFLTGN